MDVGDVAVIDPSGIDPLIQLLRTSGYRVLGPVVRDGAIVHGEVNGSADLPVGWNDRQEPGTYRLVHRGGPAHFDWAVGPASFKPEFFPPEETVWRTPAADGTLPTPAETDRPRGRVALIGARPCELAGLSALDRILRDGAVTDDRYAARRGGAFVVVVECGSPARTCFCTSMGTGPSATGDFDLALTELFDGGHRFHVQVGSAAGAEVLAAIPHRDAGAAERDARSAVLARSVARIDRHLDTSGLAELLARNLEHPRWHEVAARCLSCGNCTLVCPTCFCSDVKDVTDLSGAVERQRRWSSCFDLDHSYLHGGPVRPTTRSRYRQWLTHKLSTWWDQFGESGCVGCGRCITWCPVGIDLTEEAAAIRRGDGEFIDAGPARS